MALNDPHFVKSLQMGHSMQILSMGIWEDALVVGEHMCEDIARFQGRKCATIESDSIPVQQDQVAPLLAGSGRKFP